MTKESYKAWDGKKYKWPPPEGWYLADDELWWPQGYGPKKSPADDVNTETVSSEQDSPVNLQGSSDAADPAYTSMTSASDSLQKSVPEDLDSSRSEYKKIEEVALAAELSDEISKTDTSEAKELTDEFNVIGETPEGANATYKAAASSFIDKLSAEKPAETKNFTPESEASFSFDGLKEEVYPENPVARESLANGFQEKNKDQFADESLLEHGSLPAKSSHVGLGNPEKTSAKNSEPVSEPVSNGSSFGREVVDESSADTKKFLTFLKFALIGIFLALLVYSVYFVYNNYVKVKEGSFDSPHSQGWDVSLGLPSEEGSLWVLQVSEPAVTLSAENIPGNVVDALPGNVYLRAPVKFERKEGAGPSSLSVFEFSVSTPGKKLYPLSQECSVAIDSVDLSATLSGEESLTGFLCWEVPQEEANDMLLAIAAEGADNEVYVDLQ